MRKGKKGAAICRDETNTYGFITKRYPSSEISAFFKPINYQPILNKEMDSLITLIAGTPNRIFLISKLGGGLANKFNIRPMIIKELEKLSIYNNIIFLGGNN